MSTRPTPPPARRAPHVGYGDHAVVRDLDLAVLDGASRRSSGRTAAASPPCCARWPGCSSRSPARCCSTAADPHHADPRGRDALALLPQTPLAPEGLIVRDLVARGRHPRQPWLRQWSRDDEEVVDETLRLDRYRDLATGRSTSCPAASASGPGSRWHWPRTPTCCCSTSRRRTSTWPTRSRCSTSSQLNRERGRTVVMVLHDLNLAARYSDRLVAMQDGAVVAEGTPREVLTAEMLRDVFGLEAHCWTTRAPGCRSWSRTRPESATPADLPARPESGVATAGGSVAGSPSAAAANCGTTAPAGTGCSAP